MTPGKKLKALAENMAAFTVRERRGILWFIPIVVVVSLVVGALSRPRLERSLQLAADVAPGREEYAENVRARNELRTYGEARTERGRDWNVAAPRKLFRFDPNTIDYRGLRALGFSARASAGILKYRESGKVFRIKEEFAACWDVGDSIFYELEPYIVIGERFAIRGTGRAEERYDTVVAAHGNEARVPAAGDPFEDPQPRIVELNGADSALLVTVGGIGSLTAGRIVAYRTRLGGFARVEQLAEVHGMREGNYERILQQISLDTALIQKIDINFATPEKLAGHPYISAGMLRKIIRNRQLEGGWCTLDDMTGDGTLTAAEAARLGPYLFFNESFKEF